MQIPNTGQIAAPAQLAGGPRVSAQQLGTGEVAAAAGQLGESLGQAANAVARQRYAEEQKRQDELDRSSALAATSSFKNSTEQAVVDIQNGLQTGKLKREDAESKYQEILQKQRDNLMNNVPELHKPNVGVIFDATATDGSQKVAALVETARRDQIKANLATITDSMAKQASMPGADVAAINDQYAIEASTLGRDAGVPEAVLTKHIQDFKDTTNYGVFKNRLIDAGDNIPTLKSFVEDVKKTDLLDQDKKLAMLSAAESHINVLENRAALKAEAALRHAQATFSTLSTFFDSGRFLRPEDAATYMKQLKGTPFEAPARMLIEQAPQNVAFSSMPIGDQERTLQAQMAQLNTQGSNPIFEKMLDKRQTALNAVKESVRKDPLSASVEYNVNRDVPAVDAANLLTLPAQLAARQPAINRASVWAGQQVSPLKAGEADDFARSINSLGPDNKATALRALASQIPAPQMQAIAAQLKDKHGELGIASLLSQRDTTTGNNVGALYLKGKEALKEGRIKLDETKETGIKAQIYTMIQGAYPTPESRDAAAEATMGVWAGLRATGDGDDLKRAMRIATGGIVDRNGQKVVVPTGWTESRFNDWFHNVQPAQLGASEFMVNGQKTDAPDLTKYLQGATLLPFGSGQYFVQAGHDVVRLPDGSPYLLQVK